MSFLNPFKKLCVKKQAFSFVSVITEDLSYMFYFCWGIFYLYLPCCVFIINGCWVLSALLLIYWDSYMIFLYFINEIYHDDWFTNVASFLHLWNDHLIVVHNPLKRFLNLIYNILLKIFCIYVHQRYWPGIFLFFGILVWFYNQDNVASLNKRKNLEEIPSSFKFWKSLRKVGINSSLNIW